jgi:hypothetical protein
VTAATAPGDVITFHLHAFHASFGGCERLAWTIEYLTEPGDQAARPGPALDGRRVRTALSRLRP